jgi:hypothetical protein
MGTYVDTVRDYPDAGLRYTAYCHLLADSRDELHRLADDLGMPRQIFQDHPWRWHYDLPAHLRGLAIQKGAESIEMHQVGAMLKARREAVRREAVRREAVRREDVRQRAGSKAPGEPGAVS